MHAISGADVTGSFSGKAKASFWNRFLDSPVEVLQVLGAMGEANDVPDEHYTALEQLYISITETVSQITNCDDVPCYRCVNFCHSIDYGHMKFVNNF